MCSDKFERCLKCQEALDINGECTNYNCTDDADYDVLVGAAWDEKDMLKISIASGECMHCHAIIYDGESRCPKGCFDDL